MFRSRPNTSGVLAAWSMVLLSIARIATAEDWLEQKALFYRLRYTVEDAGEIAKIKELLESFHRAFLLDTKMDDSRLNGSDVVVEIHPHSSSTVRVGYASLSGGTDERNGKSVYMGTIQIPGPTAHDGTATGSSGHPQDRRYFDKLLIHEVAPIYLTLFVADHGTSFHESFPD